MTLREATKSWLDEPTLNETIDGEKAVSVGSLASVVVSASAKPYGGTTAQPELYRAGFAAQ